MIARPLCLALTLLVSLAHAANLGDGLAGAWQFADAAGGRVPDRSGASRSLRVTAPVLHAEAQGARSLVCDGFETFAQLEERTPLRFTQGVTLAVWVRPERVSALEPIVGRPNAEASWTTPTLGFSLVDGEPLFGVFTPKGKLALQGPAVPLHTWTFLAASLDGAQATLWINGEPAANAPQRIKLSDTPAVPWYVGRALTQFFRGRIGEIRVWSRALSPAEITGLYAETRASYPNPPSSAAAAAGPSRWNDRTVLVESPGSTDRGPWRQRPTRTLPGLDGFSPSSPPATDRWGGRCDQPALRATGFFRTERLGDRWWLVTPDGHLFWNIGVNTVTVPASVPPAQHTEFARRALSELRAFGFNGSSSDFKAQRTLDTPLPWCARINLAGSFAKDRQRTYPTAGHVGFAEQCMPVFHPDFPAWCRRQAESLRPTASDPNIIGIFTDNELQCPADLLDRHLRLDPNDAYLRPNRDAALAWLLARGRSPDPATFTLRDRYEFIAYVFGVYSRIACEAVRAADPNHLTLGSRFSTRRGQFDNPWFWRAVGPWLDVAAVNYYTQWGPQRDEITGWAAEGGKPIVFSEWYAKAMDAPGLANAHGAGWLVRTQADRARYYQHFALAAMELPCVVGIHYFKYLDDPAESIALDAVGGANKGLYTSRGEPWTELLQGAGAVNRNVYPLIDFFSARSRPPPLQPQ